MNKRLCNLVYRLELLIDDYHEATDEEHLEGAYRAKWDSSDIPVFEGIKTEWDDVPRVVRLCDEIIKSIA